MLRREMGGGLMSLYVTSLALVYLTQRASGFDVEVVMARCGLVIDLFVYLLMREG